MLAKALRLQNAWLQSRLPPARSKSHNAPLHCARLQDHTESLGYALSCTQHHAALCLLRALVIFLSMACNDVKRKQHTRKTCEQETTEALSSHLLLPLQPFTLLLNTQHCCGELRKSRSQELQPHTLVIVDAPETRGLSSYRPGSPCGALLMILLLSDGSQAWPRNRLTTTVTSLPRSHLPAHQGEKNQFRHHPQCCCRCCIYYFRHSLPLPLHTPAH